MWLDEWLLKPSDSIPRRSRKRWSSLHVLVLCMSRHNIRLTEKRPGITDIGAGGAITFTDAIGLSCDETDSKLSQ